MWPRYHPQTHGCVPTRDLRPLLQTTCCLEPIHGPTADPWPPPQTHRGATDKLRPGNQPRTHGRVPTTDPRLQTPCCLGHVYGSITGLWTNYGLEIPRGSVSTHPPQILCCLGPIYGPTTDPRPPPWGRGQIAALKSLTDPWLRTGHRLMAAATDPSLPWTHCRPTATAPDQPRTHSCLEPGHGATTDPPPRPQIPHGLESTCVSITDPRPLPRTHGHLEPIRGPITTDPQQWPQTNSSSP